MKLQDAVLGARGFDHKGEAFEIRISSEGELYILQEDEDGNIYFSESIHNVNLDVFTIEG